MQIIPFLKRRQPEFFLASIICAYTVVMSFLTIQRMYALGASAWDLGNYNQAMFTFDYSHKLFYWTPDIILNPSGSLFGVHFSPLMFLIAPIYLLYPRSETLLVIQSFVIGLGALPVWLLAQKSSVFNRSHLIILLPIVYLLQPSVLGINWFDFHPEAFIPVLYLFVFYSYISKRLWLFLLSFLLCLSTIEFASAILASLFVLLELKQVLDCRKVHDLRVLANRWNIALLSALAISIVWLFGSTHIIDAFNPTYAFSSVPTDFWSVLGARSLSNIPAQIISHPSNIMAALLFQYQQKIAFMGILTLPLLFVPLFSWRFYFLSAFWLVPAILSNNATYYEVGTQYLAFLVPPAVVVFFSRIGKLESL